MPSLDPSARTPVARAGLASLGVVVLAGLRTASRIAAMRRDGRRWEPFDHTSLLPGENPVLRLQVLGDSAAAGHGLSDAAEALPASLARELQQRTGRSIHVTCRARSGDRTRTVLDEQVPAMDRSDVLVIGVGVNDALGRNRIRKVEEDTTALVRRCHEVLPAATLVLLTCPDLGGAPGLPALVRPLVRWRCRTVAAAQARAASREGALIVPVDGPIPPTAYGSDGFHPGAEGHALLAAAIADRLVPDHVAPAE